MKKLDIPRQSQCHVCQYKYRPVEHFWLAPDEFKVVLPDGDLEDRLRLGPVEDVVHHVVVDVVYHGVARRRSSPQEGGPLTHTIQTLQTHHLCPPLGPSTHNAQNSWKNINHMKQASKSGETFYNRFTVINYLATTIQRLNCTLSLLISQVMGCV